MNAKAAKAAKQILLGALCALCVPSFVRSQDATVIIVETCLRGQSAAI